MTLYDEVRRCPATVVGSEMLLKARSTALIYATIFFEDREVGMWPSWIIKTAVAAIPATCGEFVQGIWQGQPCLVSCPIDQYSTATVTVSQAKQQAQQQPQLTKAN